MSPHQRHALHLLGLSGKVRPVRSPSPYRNEVAIPTGDWLRRKGFTERIYTGNDAGLLVVTDEGRDAVDQLNEEN